MTVDVMETLVDLAFIVLAWSIATVALIATNQVTANEYLPIVIYAVVFLAAYFGITKVTVTR